MPIRPSGPSEGIKPPIRPSGLGRIHAWDERIFSQVAATHVPIGNAVLPRLTALADHSKLWVAIAVSLGATRKPRLRRAAGRGLGSIAAASVLANQVGKRLARRERPPLGLVPVRRVAGRVPTSTSFPSGHSASAAAFAVGVALEAPELAMPLAVVAGAVCFSRVYTGVHYPSDVLAGAATGVAAAALVARLVPLPSPASRNAVPPPPVTQPARPTGRGVVAVINPAAGGGRGKELIAQVRCTLPDAEVVALSKGQDLLEALRAAAGRAEVLAVGGGDGSINAGATIAMEAGLPLLALPGGTLNHFAGDLGLLDATGALRCVQRGRARRIAVGVVTSRASAAESDTGTGPSTEQIFLNTASVGAYPDFVAARGRWEGRLGKPVAAVLAVRQVLRTAEPLDVHVDGRPCRIGLMFIGSNGYEPRGFAPQFRPSLADGLLDVRMLELSGRYPLIRFGLALQFGRIRTSRQYVELRVPRVQFVLPEAGRLARDGEIGAVQRVLSFSMRSDALTVFAP